MLNERTKPAASAAINLMLVHDLIVSMRPKQWVKNGFVFAALIFAGKLSHPALVARTLAAFLLFSLLSSAIYLINDAADAEVDRQHPVKRTRPIAAGRVPVVLAMGLAGAFIGIGIALSFVLEWRFGLLAAAYIALMAAYTFSLKHLVLIDVFCIAGGFVLRAAGGAAVIGVKISPWLYLCTILLSLFLGFGKRRQELLLLEAGASGHRRNLEEYSGPFLDELMTIVAGATIVAYSLYTFYGANVASTTHVMMITIPFVLYGVFRYLLLVHRSDLAGAPEEALYKDFPLVADLLLWAAMSWAITVFIR